MQSQGDLQLGGQLGLLMAILKLPLAQALGLLAASSSAMPADQAGQGATKEQDTESAPQPARRCATLWQRLKLCLLPATPV